MYKKYQWKQSGVQFGHGSLTGQVEQIDDAEAKKLLKKGAIVEVDEQDATDLPEDIPGRDVLVSYELSLEDVKSLTAEQLVDLKGIGKKMAENIIQYFEPETEE